MVTSMPAHRSFRLLGLACLVSACAMVSPTPTQPPGDELPVHLEEWASGARDMVWRHVRPGDPPPLPVVRFEMCSDLALAFFLDPESGSDGVLWAAGSPSEPPEGADGGFSRALDTPEIQAYREEHGPCDLIHETHYFR